MTLTQDRLREVLDYSPSTGEFTRKVTTSKRYKPGCIAGTLGALGYIRIQVDGVVHPAHRLAWLWVYGEMPETDIDHANGDRADNRLSNLRVATRSQNSSNSKLRADNSSGFKGVYQHGRNWKAQIRFLGKLVTIGTFSDPHKAHLAYMDKARELFGDFARAA